MASLRDRWSSLARPIPSEEITIRALQIVWPTLAVMLAVMSRDPGTFDGKFAFRFGLALTPIGAVVGAVLSLQASRGLAVGAVGSGFVLNTVALWCAIGSVLAASRATKSRLVLALASAAGGLSGTFLSFLLTLSVVCASSGNCL